jgi:CheY-like chemotaxis protein
MLRPASPRPRPPRAPKAPREPLARVLIVVPDARVLARLADGLEAGRLATVRFRDTRRALACEDLPSVSAVVGALGLGGSDGLELLCALKAAPETRHLPVVLLSSCEVGHVEPLAVRLGADAVLPLEVEADVLREALRRLVGP